MKNTTNTKIIPVLPVHVEAAPAGLVVVMAEAANEKALLTPLEKVIAAHPQIQQQREQYSQEHIRQMCSQMSCRL